MKIPKTPIEFDYDLWTTEDGKCMVRVKRTGEVTEVDRKVMRMLRAEEKRIRRAMKEDDDDEDATLLSLDTHPEDENRESPWAEDAFDFTEEIAFREVERGFFASLTDIQKEIYTAVIVERVTPFHYAKSKGVSASSVSQQMKAIRNRAKKHFKLF